MTEDDQNDPHHKLIEGGGIDPNDFAPLLPPSPPSDAASASPLPVALTTELEADDVYTPAPKSNPVVDALIAAGLYLEAVHDDFHRLTCPWASEHPPGDSSQAGYLEPGFGNPIGRFRCGHAHSERRDEQCLIDHLGITAAVARAKPTIRLLPGESHRAAAAAERVLAADGRYFDAGGPIVRIVERPGRDVSSEQVAEQTLITFLASKIDWERKVRGKEWERCEPPPNIVQGLRYGQDRPHLRKLSGLARQPFYGSDGRLITSSGYDTDTGIYAAFDQSEYDLGEPTRDAAEHSLDYLKWLLREFHFASDSDQSAAIAAMLTAAIRTSLPQAPAFNINATRSGSGKSYLASMIALVAGPGDPYSVSYPTKADEAAKVVLAMLLEKPSVILFDDMQTDWKSLGPLNRALTSPTTTERLLGSNRTATARTNVLFLGTGNNMEPEADMRRRVVSIRLAPPGETPALLTYRDNPVGHIRKNRPHVVAAALTIIEAFRAAGRPLADVPTIGSYEEWSTLCRHSLMWLGEPDPATSLIEQVSHDSDQEVLGEFLDVLWELFGSRPVTVRKIVAAAADNPNLMDALAEIGVVDGRNANPGRLGWYLKQNCGRRADQLRIERAESSERRAWRVMAS